MPPTCSNYWFGGSAGYRAAWTLHLFDVILWLELACPPAQYLGDISLSGVPVGPPCLWIGVGINHAFLAYDVVATTVLLWRLPTEMASASSREQTYPNRLWCIWELFTLLAFVRWNRRSNEYALWTRASEVSCCSPPVALRRPTCTVCVSMAAVVCNEKPCRLCQAMFCVCTCAYTDDVRASARHI